MAINQCSKVPSFILATVLSTASSFISPAFAQEGPQPSFIIDVNSKAWTKLGLHATDMNDAGQVTGGSGGRAFITGPDGVGMTELDMLPESISSLGTAINNAGKVAGVSSFAPAPSTKIFITGPDGIGITDLGFRLGCCESSHPAGINNYDQMIGNSSNRFVGFKAFMINLDGLSEIPIEGLPGHHFSAAGAINDAGQVAGTSYPETGLGRAFITGPDGIGITDLGTLGGGGSRADGINNAGQVSGSSLTTQGEWHAFITGPNGVGMSDLGTLGGDYSVANAINDAGLAVGDSLTTSGESHAFIMDADGASMIDLNSLVDLPDGVILTTAIDVNNQGQVLVHAIPEPEAYALMLAGLGLIGFMARRKKTENLIKRY